MLIQLGMWEAVVVGQDPFDFPQETGGRSSPPSLAMGGACAPTANSWIAATAMSLGLPVVTQDENYVSVAGLEVIRV